MLILTKVICLVARVALSNINIFMQLMQATAAARGIPETQLWEGLLDQWWRTVSVWNRWPAEF